jgi:futalosine hydrolase
MILAVAATEFEMTPLLDVLRAASCRTLISGVGPVESCLRLTRYLETISDTISMVVNFGVAGAFIKEMRTEQPELLDICLAETEVFGDLGICYPMRIDDFTGSISPPKHFYLDEKLRKVGERVLKHHGINSFSGNFVTVNSVSGTLRRGEMLSEKHNGLCENMEGAAIARVCEEFSLPLLQLRCISNYVEDRDPAKWSLQQACEKSGRTAALIIQKIGKEHGAA